MADGPIILTTPPVHVADPDGAGAREIEGGEASRTGFDSRLRDALEALANDLASKHSIPFVVPVRPICDTVAKLLPDMPRVPDYDATSALVQRWTESTRFSLTELPEREAKGLGVHVNGKSGLIDIEIDLDGVSETIRLDPAQAKGFFLAGLAAVASTTSP